MTKLAFDLAHKNHFAKRFQNFINDVHIQAETSLDSVHDQSMKIDITLVINTVF